MVQSLGLGLDPRSGEPMYRQIFDQVVARIRSGAFPAGFRLPPTRSLAGALGTNRNTVVRAYDDLLAAGFVESTVGRGTFVARPQPRAAKGAGASATTRSAGSPGDAAGEGGLPWSTLVARAALAEPLSRVERLQRSVSAMSTDTINLARMEPSPDQIPDELLRRSSEHVFRTLGARALAYSAREGLPRLRALIAEDLARQGVPAAADDIVVTSGSQQALDLISRALLNPGDPFLVNDSTYGGALNVLGAAGARAVPVPSDDEGPSLAALERVVHLGAKGFYLMPSSHNPTGASLSEGRREALVAWSRRAGVPLVEDDFVADLDLDGGPAPTPLRALDGDVIYVGSFSKRLAPALRVGFLVVPAGLRPKVMLLKYTLDLGNSQLLQHVLAEFLERGYLGAHLAKAIPEYRRRRDALEEGLGRHLPKELALTWRRPQRGLALWLPLPAGLSPQAVFEEARRKGVLVHPSSLNTVEESAPGGVRLTFCCEPEARLAEGARRLGKAIATFSRGQGDEPVPALGGI
jgi:GntR family transcriptional regulator/MocR family aminotransferase